MKKYLPTFLAIAAITTLAGCSKEIDGSVIDGDGNPLERSTVQIKNSRFSSETGNNGKYSIDYAPGDFEITYKKKNYISKSLKLNIQQKVQYPAPTITLHKFKNKTPEEFSISVIETLAANDKETFDEYSYPDREKLIDYIKLHRGENDLNTITKLIDDEIAIEKTKISSSWGNVYLKGISSGINWESAKFSRAEYKLKDKQADIYVFITDNNKEYQIKLDDTGKIGDSWYIFDRLHWR